MSVRKSLSGILVLIFAAIVLAACGGAAGREAAYLKRGKAYMARQDYPKAEIELRNVLQIDPKNAEACYLLARSEEKQGNYQPAFGYYAKAIELKPDYPAAQARLGTFYLLSGNLAKASQTADAILNKHPTDAGGQLLKAAVMARQGNAQGAIKEASGVLAVDPSNYQAASLLAVIYDNQGDTAKGIAVLQDAISKNPKNVPLRISLIRLYAKNSSDYAKAEQLFREIIAIEPTKLQPRIMFASFLVQINQVDLAEQVLRDAVQANPKDVRRHVTLAEFLAVKKSVAQAEAELQKTIQSYPDSDAPRFALATLYARTNEPAKAEATYREIISRDDTKPSVLKARDQLAALLVQEGRTDEGMKLIKNVLKENPQDNDALLLQGTIALQQGHALTAMSAFRSILKDQPTSAKVLALLAQANLMNHAPDLAKEELQRAVSDNPNDANARLRLAQYLMQEHDSGAALKLIDQALVIAPNDPGALQAKADVMLTRHDSTGAVKALEQLSAAYPKDPTGPYRLGQLYGSQKQYAQAESQFELALARAPQAPQPLTALINAYVMEGAPKKAVARLQKLIKTSPDDAPAHELLGEVYMRIKQYPDAAKELNRTIAIAPKWDAPYVNLARFDLQRGDGAGALALYQQGLKAIPGDQQLLLALAGYYESKQDYHDAIATYRTAVKANPANAVATNNLAALLVIQGGDARLKEAQKLSARLASSPVPAFQDTAGWVDLKSCETDKAIALLTKAVNAAPQVPIFQYHLGVAYRQKGDVANAKIHLAKAAAARDFAQAGEARKMLDSLH